MAKVKVWNDNVYPFTEAYGKFKGLTIEPGAFVEMDEEEAAEFMACFSPIVKRGDGTDDPRYFKKLRKERLAPTVLAAVDPLMNHVTGRVAGSPEELLAQARELAHLRAHDAEAEKAATEALRAENAALAARLAAIEAKLGEKRGPGRPRKEANG